jgi:hypothetical protein
LFRRLGFATAVEVLEAQLGVLEVWEWYLSNSPASLVFASHRRRRGSPGFLVEFWQRRGDGQRKSVGKINELIMIQRLSQVFSAGLGKE